MVLHALSAARPDSPRTTWKEIGGFLLGKWLPNGEILLTDLVSVSSGSSVFVSISDPQALQYIPWERVEAGEPIVGWFHTHPGHGLFLSITDQQTQLAYQHHNPKTVALVMDPTLISENDSGVRAFKLEDITNQRTSEVKIDVQTDQNYLDVKNQVYKELSIPPLVIEEPAIIENEFLILKGPNQVNNAVDFKCEVFLKSQEQRKVGITYVSYSLEYNNLILNSRMISTFLRHKVNQSGLLSRFSFKSKSTEKAKIMLSGITLRNIQGEKMELNSLRHIMSITELEK